MPDREAATAQAWPAAHPTISIVARDRGGGYGEAAAKALPHAMQVADHCHLVENASGGDSQRPYHRRSQPRSGCLMPTALSRALM
ncbi:hypothetical protein QCM77_35635 [Bradyrhizobium sp. SSUT18]|uniref:hypothetical protein n=1 Tax=Bradyrhizobium sp. SSUT18 TaxID=3040602 RepID=UPI002448D03B|nr:hypothetical protein [Bradyrhizobium sp. SSUT18]MDH2405199.1 hypothetical protein [Bradyrhizobium sp. SSUT18]